MIHEVSRIGECKGRMVHGRCKKVSSGSALKKGEGASFERPSLLGKIEKMQSKTRSQAKHANELPIPFRLYSCCSNI